MPLKILVIQPNYDFIRSHFRLNLSLAELLKRDGHHVHMLVPIECDEDKCGDNEAEERLNIRYFPVKNPPKSTAKRLREARSMGDTAIDVGTLKSSDDNTFLEIAECAEVMDCLKAHQFDVGICEVFRPSEYALATFRLLGIPISVATHAMPPNSFQLYLLGVLSKMKWRNVPACGGMRPGLKGEQRLKSLGARFGDYRKEQRMERAEQMWRTHVEKAVEQFEVHLKQDTDYQKIAEDQYGMKQFPGWDQLFRQTRFFLINSLPELDFDEFVALQPIEKVKFIGGFNLRPANRNLDQTIISMAQGKNGVVLISFGTVTDTIENGNLVSKLWAEQPKWADVDIVKGAIGHFPEYLFVWKLSKEDPNIQTLMEELPNVFATDWVDQQAILENSLTKAFVCHCGMNSVLEAIYNGVPIVGVPIFGDQFYNSQSIARQKFGVAVDAEEEEEGKAQEEVRKALAEVLRNERFDESENQRVDLAKLKRISAELRKRDPGKTITEIMHRIEEELMMDGRIVGNE